jgi:NADPH:quinone reductase-like Zn-dependent oxidoreductase
MRAVLVHETGNPDVLRIEDAERPQPGEGEALIRVRAASVNPIDWKYRRGFAEDDEVFGIATSGGYAEFAIAPAATLARKPAGVSYEQAAAIPVAGLTAWQALFDRGGLEPGQTALIAGAAGGVGHLAVQFAKHAGARAIGTGSSRNRDFVLGLGADEYLDYTQQDVAEAAGGVDVAFDTVGGETTGSLLPTLREGGILVTIAGAPPEEAARELGLRAELLVMSPNSEQLSRIAELVKAGDVRVELAETVPLAEVRRAHELSESGHTRGKIILTVDSPDPAA